MCSIESIYSMILFIFNKESLSSQKPTRLVLDSCQKLFVTKRERNLKLINIIYSTENPDPFHATLLSNFVLSHLHKCHTRAYFKQIFYKLNKFNKFKPTSGPGALLF